MRELRQISVLGMGLLGSSLTLAVKRSFPDIKTIGHSHRKSTREKAASLGVADEIAEDIPGCVNNSDIVILATPICTFEDLFEQIGPHLKKGCIVTDVGSTKSLAHKWAAAKLPKQIEYIGSHPIAGSEKRGVEFARDDLFFSARCILTFLKNSNRKALDILDVFWSKLGCNVIKLSPAEHDKIYAKISHVPHVVAAALVNASDPDHLAFAGKGFIDTSRIASGPSNIWTDILLTNSRNSALGIGKVIKELQKLQKAIESEKPSQIQKLLENARMKREMLIEQKMKMKELF